jgi:hypothetical protein
MKTILEKTVWVGRGTVLLVALAMILALTFGAASQVWAGKKAGSSRLLIDVQGNNPTSTNVATVSRLRTGVFLLEFEREVEDCHRLVSLGSERGGAVNADTFTPDGGEVRADSAFRSQSDDADGRLVMVTTRDSAGTLEDKSFHLAVFCPIRR